MVREPGGLVHGYKGSQTQQQLYLSRVHDTNSLCISLGILFAEPRVDKALSWEAEDWRGQ